MRENQNHEEHLTKNLLIPTHPDFSESRKSTNITEYMHSESIKMYLLPNIAVL